MTFKTSTLNIACHSGLCNRLRVLLSAHIASLMLNKKMNFIWIKNSRCGADFSDLFENKEFNIVKRSFIYGIFYKYFHKEINFGDDKSQDQFMFDILNTNVEDKVIRSCVPLFFSDNEFLNHSKLRKDSEMLFDTLRPVSFIKNEVDNFVKNNFSEGIKIMGIHIRRGDFMTMFSNKTKNTEIFIKEMKDFLIKNPDGKFFVATDDGAPSPWGEKIEKENILNKLIERFGKEKILYYKPRNLNRVNKKAIQDALITLLILRKTDEFVGNCYSSFSGTVMINRDVPQKRV